MCGAYSCMAAYKRDVVAVIKWVLIHMGCLFVWVLIIPILRYQLSAHDKSLSANTNSVTIIVVKLYTLIL